MLLQAIIVPDFIKSFSIGVGGSSVGVFLAAQIGELPFKAGLIDISNKSYRQQSKLVQNSQKLCYAFGVISFLPILTLYDGDGKLKVTVPQVNEPKISQHHTKIENPMHKLKGLIQKPS